MFVLKIANPDSVVDDLRVYGTWNVAIKGIKSSFIWGLKGMAL